MVRRGIVVAVLAVTLIGFSATGAEAALSISVPASANLGSTPVSGPSRSAQLGTVTVNASGLVAPSFVVTVSTSVFTTGAGTANETLPKSKISYWSGPATATTGTFSSITPGQPNAASAQTLVIPRTAFSAVGLVLTIAVSWNPTVIVTIPSAAVAGTYTGTITHSVA